jgi:hypothetical protein
MKATEEITNTEDILDSWDIIARIDYLDDEDYEKDEDELEELANLKAFAEQLEGYGDFKHGESLIRESYFEKYCRELVSDIGDMPKDIPAYIEHNINWEGVADDLRADYAEAEFNGVTYLMRS